jgi:peptide-methionine (S)-S-oxide reductase
VGPQYRSGIFYHTEEQREIAERKIAELNEQGLWSNKIVTEVTPVSNYYDAEDYHQEYYARNPYAGYCQVVIAPKVAKFRKKFMEQLKA